MAIDAIESFLSGDCFAVVGASRDARKYGNKVLRAYQQNGLEVHPINPSAQSVEGLVCFPSLEALLASDHVEKIHGVSIITPPRTTEAIVESVVQLEIGHVWMQPGAESPQAITTAERAGLNVIAGGPCILVSLGFHE